MTKMTKMKYLTFFCLLFLLSENVYFLVVISYEILRGSKILALNSAVFADQAKRKKKRSIILYGAITTVVDITFSPLTILGESLKSEKYDEVLKIFMGVIYGVSLRRLTLFF